MGTGRKWEMLGKDSDESQSWELRARVEIPLVSRTGRERRREYLGLFLLGFILPGTLWDS